MTVSGKKLCSLHLQFILITTLLRDSGGERLKQVDPCGPRQADYMVLWAAIICKNIQMQSWKLKSSEVQVPQQCT